MHLKFNHRIYISCLQETSVLQYHSIRPGDRLAFHNKRTVRKLLAKVNGRFFFIPVSHRGHFAYVDDHSSSATGLPVMLSELSVDATFPFRMRYHRRAGARSSTSDDAGLPDGVPMRVDALVSEPAVLATKINHDLTTCQAFLLPLRTRISVGVEKAGDTLDRSRMNIVMSDCVSYAEEVSEDVYNCALNCTSGRDDTEPRHVDAGNCTTSRAGFRGARGPGPQASHQQGSPTKPLNF